MGKKSRTKLWIRNKKIFFYIISLHNNFRCIIGNLTFNDWLQWKIHRFRIIIYGVLTGANKQCSIKNKPRAGAGAGQQKSILGTIHFS